MLNKRLLAGIAGLATLGLAVPAMAQEVPTETSDTVEVQIVVEAVAAISAPNSILLTLNSPGAENWALEQSSLTHRNNTNADVSVGIAHTSGDLLPVDLVYWLFRNMDDTAANAHLVAGSAANSVTDGTLAGSFSFTGAAVNTGFTDVLFANLVKSVDDINGDTFPVVYAADARASLPPPSDSLTTVTWTITTAN
jgi:hypothetical protein